MVINLADSNYMSEIISGFLGAFIMAMITKKNNDNNNALKYITEERQKWREDIRKIVDELYEEDYDFEKIRAKLQVRLNPFDEYDKDIIKKIEKLICFGYKNNTDYIYKLELAELLSRLLKHDWERAKIEANKNSFFPEWAILTVYFTIAVILEILLYIIFNDLSILKKIYMLITKPTDPIVFYIVFTLFLMAWIQILFNFIYLYLDKEKFKDKKELLYKLFKIPIRK